MDMPLNQPPAAQDSASIDKEHAVQLEMLDAFCSLVEESAPQEKIHEMMDQLISYSEVHFMSEQLLMRMYAYTDYEDHVYDHQCMIEHLTQMKQRYLSGKENMALEIANEMRNFLLGHIRGRDQAFASYLSNMKTS
jgi:hemerythrin-like metal-binding protein